jgi:hypothetical protein
MTHDFGGNIESQAETDGCRAYHFGIVYAEALRNDGCREDEEGGVDENA